MPKCPTCKRPIADASDVKGEPLAPPPLPFCSVRCKLADLHGWLSGRYVISEALPFSEEHAARPNDDDE